MIKTYTFLINICFSTFKFAFHWIKIENIFEKVEHIAFITVVMPWIYNILALIYTDIYVSTQADVYMSSEILGTSNSQWLQ